MKGYCSLIIKGDTLKFDEIEKNIGLKVSQKYLRGEIVSKVIGMNKFDLIRFDECISENLSLNDTLEILLNRIITKKHYINQIQGQYEVVLKCYIQSSDAQVRFEIIPDNIAKINQLGVKLEISVLSWGHVDNE